MKQMKRITLRLSLENPSDKRIADFLANIDKNKYHIPKIFRKNP